MAPTVVRLSWDAWLLLLNLLYDMRTSPLSIVSVMTNVDLEDVVMAFKQHLNAVGESKQQLAVSELTKT